MSLLEMMMRYTVCSTYQAFTYILSPTFNTYLYGDCTPLQLCVYKSCKTAGCSIKYAVS
jgi:hypothetical protein